MPPDPEIAVVLRPRFALLAAALVLASGCQSHRATIIYTNRPAPPRPAGAATDASRRRRSPSRRLQPTIDVAGAARPDARVPRRLGRDRRQHRLAVAAGPDRPRSSRPSCARILDRARRDRPQRASCSRSAPRPTRSTTRRSSRGPSYLTGREGESPGYDPLAFAVAARRTRAGCSSTPGSTRSGPAMPGGSSHAGRPRHARAPRVDRPLRRPHVDRPRRARRRGPLARRPARPRDALRHRRPPPRRLLLPVPDRGARPAVPPTPGATARAQARRRDARRAADWRRQNVNRFVERLYGEVRAAKPDVHASA